MVTKILRKVIGSRNDRILKRYSKAVREIAGLESEMQSLSDSELAQKTDQLRERVTRGESFEDLLPEAFAVVREAGVRALEMRHFDEQMLGGIALHNGHIAEMRTGEGKTLVATLPAYLNALGGESVHIVTVNDYLARRDAEWMGKLYNLLGMSVGVVVPGQTAEEKRAAYQADITYGTNNEYGFDYLRDNMAFSMEEKAQRGLGFAIVDEVDSILIDEARTPLIISGPSEESSDLYTKINPLIQGLERQDHEEKEGEEVTGDYYVDEKGRQVYLTERGHQNAEQLLEGVGLLSSGESLYDPANIVLMHHFNAALRAHSLFQRDVHYIVQGGEVVIVDEFTGRTMPGRRWSEGLHQAVEAKEGVSIQQENQTLASITFQNYFRLYGKLSGMTGTADTEAAEFQQIYGLEVVIMPTHLPMVRDDMADLVFLTKEEKYAAIVEDIKASVEANRPVLVGTASIETSEYLSGVLDKAKISHEVLNAKQHEREAHIVAQAGQPGAITIATNMAGRGTDIVLGGNWQAEVDDIHSDEGRELRSQWEDRHKNVLDAGGLHIIGTERHESRRIDNQLRGRSGRQGDPGSSRFYLSLEDDLMRIFASESVAKWMRRIGMEDGEAIEHSMVTKAIENAQRKVEGRNFDIRKQLLEYDDVANDQRKEIYALRDELMSADDVSEMVAAVRNDTVEGLIDVHIPPESLEEQWDVPGLEQAIEGTFGEALPLREWLNGDDSLHEESLRRKVLEGIEARYVAKAEDLGPDMMKMIEKGVMLQVLDASWKEHLAAMDYLRQGIHLRGYAQKNPKQEYKREAFEMFSNLLEGYKGEVISVLSKGQIRAREEMDTLARLASNQDPREMEYEHAEVDGFGGTMNAEAGGGADSGNKGNTFVRSSKKIGRNEVCPCGSGKKYKHCHGRLH